MFLNNRELPAELLHYKALSSRRELTREEQYQMSIVQKGFEGEILYDKIFEETGHNHVYIFRDVYLKIGNTVTQYDSIVISDNHVTVNEVKNFQGDFHFEKDNWYKNGKLLEEDAFSQLRRARGKLMKLSKGSGVNFTVDGALIFINDDFRLTSDNDDIWDKTVMRNHLRNHFKNLNSRDRGEKAKKIANIINKYIVSNVYFDKKADFSKLRLGLYCGDCNNFDLEKRRIYFLCTGCGAIETNDTHILRAINDYKYLFYKQEITKGSILELIDNMITPSTVGRALKKYCLVINKGKRSTHIFKYYDLNSALKSTDKRRYKDKVRKT